MKRTASALVEYPGSGDEGTQDKADERSKNFQLPKRRKLPPLSSSLVVPVPVDNPALHQGRVRTTPHIEGQFAAHVYVSLTLSRRSQLYKTIQDILSDAKEVVPSLHDIWSAEDRRLELHVSLSRPIFLRAHQREEFKRAVKNIAKVQKSFQVSFATLSELTNDEKTRTFLTMEIGAGFPEMRNLSEALSPALRSIRQQEYYTNPKFHASIGWALLHQAQQRKVLPTKSPELPSTPADCAADSSGEGRFPNQELPTISSLPQEVITALNEKYSVKVSSSKDGIFTVEALTLKIGKETFAWNFENGVKHATYILQSSHIGLVIHRGEPVWNQRRREQAKRVLLAARVCMQGDQGRVRAVE